MLLFQTSTMGKHFSWAIFIMKTNEDIIKKHNWSTNLMMIFCIIRMESCMNYHNLSLMMFFKVMGKCSRPHMKHNAEMVVYWCSFTTIIMA